MHAVAVSYLEWIRWVATGWFRCADRVVWLEGSEDQPGVDALMDRTPDLQVSDDQGYLIACLKPDALLSRRHNSRERSLGQLWLSVAAVSSFHPLSSRGARLLEADAERAAVRLGEPLFERSWVDWRDRRLEDEAHWRGLSLCNAFGLELPTLKSMPQVVTDILSGRKEPPNAASVRDGAFEGTRAIGWVSAMSVAVIDPAVKATFKETPEYESVNILIKTLKNDFDLRRPLLDDTSVLDVARDIDRVLQRLGAEVPPLSLMATILHYRSLALGARELTLRALIQDLIVIATESPVNAAIGAYFIGQGMENVGVTTLLYQSSPDRYSALVPAAGENLNVITQVHARLEAIHKTVENAQEATLTTDSSSQLAIVNPGIGGASSKTEELCDEKHSFVNQPDTLIDSSTPRADEANNAIPKDTSFDDAVLERSLIQTPTQARSDNLSSLNNLDSDQLSCIGSEALEQVAPVPSKTKEKNKTKIPK
jgi:hypothetical protein